MNIGGLWAPQDLQLPVSTPGQFHTLEIYTDPYWHYKADLCAKHIHPKGGLDSGSVAGQLLISQLLWVLLSFPSFLHGLLLAKQMCQFKCTLCPERSGIFDPTTCWHV